MTSTLRREGGPRKDVVRESKRSKNPKLDIIKALPLIHFKIPLRNLEQKVAHIISLGDCCDGNVLRGPRRIFAQRAKLDPWRDGTGIGFLPDCAPGTPCYLRKHSLARRFLDQTGAHFVRGALHFRRRCCQNEMGRI